jgi:hypothetical protein
MCGKVCFVGEREAFCFDLSPPLTDGLRRYRGSCRSLVMQNNKQFLLAYDPVLSQILLEFECGHSLDIIMLRAQQTAETR